MRSGPDLPCARWGTLCTAAPAPFRLDLRADGTSRLLLFGQVPNTARALLDREAQRTRASAALVHSA